jgi:cyanosortase A-associated protein
LNVRFLSGLSLGIAFVTFFTILFPQVGRRQVPPLTFPSQLDLNGWIKESSFPLSEGKSQVDNKIQQFRSGQQYQYRQQDTEITIELRHIGGTFGNVKKLIRTYTEQDSAYQEGNLHSLKGIGNYRLFHDKNHAYLTTCITAQGESAISSTHFIRKMNRNLLKLNGDFLSGLIGQTSLRDRNCLWVHLSTPLQQDSPEDSYRRLESVFKAGYSQWQGLFEQRSRLVNPN